MKTLIKIAALGACATALVACGPGAPQATTPSGQAVQSDKGISGEVTGTAVGTSTMIAVFGAFTNIGSNNKIDTNNKTIDADTTLTVSPVASGKYNFGLPKAPQKANAAAFKVFAFNDVNGNKLWDQGELKSKEATITWSSVTGYTLAQDADGNNVLNVFEPFKDFDFKLDAATTAG